MNIRVLNTKYYKRSDGAMRLYVTFSDKSNKQFLVRGKSDREAKKILMARLHSYLEDCMLHGTTPITVGDAWDKYLKDYKRRVKETSYLQVRARGHAHFVPILNKRLSDMTRADWQRIIDKAAENGAKSPKTIKGLMCVIRAFQRFCAASGMIQESDCCTIFLTPIGLKTRQKRVLSKEGVRLLFEPSDEFFIHCFRFLYLTGLRRGEFCALQTERDYIDGILHIRESISHEGIVTDGKTDNANRLVPVVGMALDSLHAHQQLMPSGKYLFCDERGGQIQPRHLRNRWQRWQERNGLEPISLHELRHSYISFAYNHTALELDGIKTLVGHSKAFNTIRQYVHDDQDDQERAERIKQLALLHAQAMQESISPIARNDL